MAERTFGEWTRDARNFSLGLNLKLCNHIIIPHRQFASPFRHSFCCLPVDIVDSVDGGYRMYSPLTNDK